MEVYWRCIVCFDAIRATQISNAPPSLRALKPIPQMRKQTPPPERLQKELWHLRGLAAARLANDQCHLPRKGHYDEGAQTGRYFSSGKRKGAASPKAKPIETDRNVVALAIHPEDPPAHFRSVEMGKGGSQKNID